MCSMEQRGLELPRQPEGEKTKEKPKTSLLERLRGRWPRRLTYLLAGMGFVASLETKTGVPSAALIRRIEHAIVLSMDSEKAFSRSFEIPEESSCWEVFAVVETTPAAVEQLRADPNFYDRRVMGSSDDKKYIAVRFLQDTEVGKAALNQYKNQGLISDFIVDSVEVRSDLEKGDYRNILGILFGEGKSFKKALALMGRVRIIDSPPEERKMPEAYGIEGEKAAYFRPRGGSYNIEFQKTFVERADLLDEAATFFHEMGHALAYVTSNGSYFPKSWPDVMKKDAFLRRDSADTFFSYPLAIKNPDLRAREDFAESVSLYFRAPGFLFDNAPGRFEIVDKIVKGYLEDPKFDIKDKSLDLMTYLFERKDKEYTKLTTRMHEDYKSFQKRK